MDLILLSGKAGCGKTTVGNMLKEIIEEDEKRVILSNFADLLKYIAKTFFDWNGEKDKQGRYLLQHIGTDIIRKEDENFWTGFIEEMIYFFGDKWDYMIITDARFPNEIDFFKEHEFMNNNLRNTFSFRLIRDELKTTLSPEAQRHESETALDDYCKFDQVFHVQEGLDEVKKIANDIYDIVKE